MVKAVKYFCIVEIQTDSGLLIPFIVNVMAENEWLARHAAMAKVTLNIRDSHGLRSGFVAYVNDDDVISLS